MSTYYVPNARLLQSISAQQGEGTESAVRLLGLLRSWCKQREPSVDFLKLPRPAQNPKGFYLPASESVGTYGRQVGTATVEKAPPAVLVGVRACELRAQNYLDKVLAGGEFSDPAYTARREATTIVSCDCAACATSCFCTLVGGRPFATEGYDVNLTPLDGGFVAEVATEKGRRWLDVAGLPEPSAEQLAAREKIRREMTERVRSQNAPFSFSASDGSPPALPEQDDPRWQAFAADCVECAACTNICPTCYCFYLYDQAPQPDLFERVRNWDSCLLGTYHRMAGTPNMKASPRPRLFSRLANRVLHKFVYSPQQVGLLGCVGCGRCVDACLGAIDIRRAVQELSP